MTIYEIIIDGLLVETTSLSGLAHLKYDTACMVGSASLIKVVNTGDPVIDGRFEYQDCDWWKRIGPVLPPCPKDPKTCKYLRSPEDLDLQRNAFRVEIMTPSCKCGWDLKTGRRGGHDSDYKACRRGL